MGREKKVKNLKKKLKGIVRIKMKAIIWFKRMNLKKR